MNEDAKPEVCQSVRSSLEGAAERMMNAGRQALQLAEAVVQGRVRVICVETTDERYRACLRAEAERLRALQSQAHRRLEQIRRLLDE